MKNMKKLAISLISLTFLGSCASYTPVKADAEITTYLVLSSIGLYDGNPGEKNEELFLENVVTYTAPAGSALPGADVITSTSEATFSNWMAYEGKGAPTRYDTVPSTSGKILYANFLFDGNGNPGGGGGGGDDPVTSGYTVKVGSNDAITMQDVTSTSDKGSDTWIYQYYAKIDAAANDVVTFYKDGDAIAPGASGTTNNLLASGGTLTVKTAGTGLDLYLKVYSDGYDTWLTGYDAGGSEGTGEMTNVTFSVTKDSGYGNSVYLVGSFCSTAWKIDTAYALTWTTGNVWTGTFEFEIGTTIEYKYVISPSNAITGSDPATWEGGSNHTLTISEGASVNDNWQ